MSRRHPLILPLLALLLATRALVPTGWMPVADAGGVHITLCTGQGLVTATLGPDGKLHPHGPSDKSHHDPCPYGTLGHAVIAPTLAEFVATPAPAPEVRLAPLTEQLTRAQHAPRPPTRGPPSFA